MRAKFFGGIAYGQKTATVASCFLKFAEPPQTRRAERIGSLRRSQLCCWHEDNRSSPFSPKGIHAIPGSRMQLKFSANLLNDKMNTQLTNEAFDLSEAFAIRHETEFPSGKARRRGLSSAIILFASIVGLWLSAPATFAADEICASCGAQVSVTGEFRASQGRCLCRH